MYSASSVAAIDSTANSVSSVPPPSVATSSGADGSPPGSVTRRTCPARFSAKYRSPFGARATVSTRSATATISVTPSIAPSA